MSADSHSKSSPLFELRNASLALLALVLKTPDLARLQEAFEEEFGENPALFDHDPVVIDLSPLAETAEPVDFVALQGLLRQRRMLPVAVRGGTAEQMAAALEAGLSESSSLTPLRPQPAEPAAAQPAAQPAPATRASPAPAARVTPAQPAAAPQPAAAAEPAAPSPTLVIDRPLRSGQQVYAKGGDLIVLAAVNFGAEVIADGHIHVYAPLRGRAIAGARGNTAARIFSTCLEPQLVAIAGIYRTTETALPPEVLSRPAQVWLDGDALIVEPLEALKN